MTSANLTELPEEEIARGTLRDEGGPIFWEPWEAQAFAIKKLLCQKGLFSEVEWSAVLGEEIRRAQDAQDPDKGDTYYQHWVTALERIVGDKTIATADALKRCRMAWDAAARRTPHGKPIELPKDWASGLALS
ncbi:nitrile hydratase accessory protein [Kaistia terrae]|uniref:Nitrile hydratase accessory protein n=1 Tax=Kaistia terrae TaxID=537017 RepID=A0ABW0Q208_9HYPH|nr:nitrile hydratase accessory protein [Kaistia terrae]MCX5581545.1 nitrile hydratase accessory protein [Kaistia terrae]